MDQNLNNAQSNLNEAKENLAKEKSDMKSSITDHIEQVRVQINEHIDHMADIGKEAIVEAAQAVKKVAETVEEKLTKE